jgi:hypothetical protein
MRVEPRLHGIEAFIVEQARDFEVYPMLARPRLAGAAVAAVEMVRADIGRAGQHPMHALHPKRAPAALGEARRIERP